MSITTRTAWAVILLTLPGAALHALADEIRSVSAHSPDGKNVITFRSDDRDAPRSWKLTITRGGKELLQPSRLGMRLADGGELVDGSRIVDVEEGRSDETFRPPWGKSETVANRGSWVRARLVSARGVAWELEARAYDDGVAFRYTLPKQDRLDAFTLAAESTQYRFAGEPTIHFTICKNFTTDHETEYQRQPLAALPVRKLIDLPLLAVWPDGTAAGITEARIRDFAGMYLERTADVEQVVLQSRLSPLPGRSDACVAGRTPHASPWRTVLLGDHAGRLLESNLLLCLNEPAEGDYAWARPGKTTWHWWNGTAETGLPFAVGMNLETHKYYIDFCARNGIAYHAVVADDRPWHVQAKPDFAPQPDTDILTPRAGLELDKVIEYARQRGVGIRLWVHWKPLEQRLEEAFARYEAWGVSGLMVDFLDRDDQQIVNFCERVLKSAAKHKLHIQFHGSYKPSGEQRTFPHLFNREGVLNLEYAKWSNLCTPPHDVAVAYTRLLAGPLDYHLGGFRAASRATFRFRNENPFVLGTRCHHLAMYVVYENPMPMVADAPSAYDGQAGFDFLVEVPTTWDETRFLVGEASEFIVMARRKGKTWYLGGMTNWTARKVEVPLAFLAEPAYFARLYVDGSLDEEEPNVIRIERRAVTSTDVLPISLAPGGGFAAVIEPK